MPVLLLEIWHLIVFSFVQANSHYFAIIEQVCWKLCLLLQMHILFISWLCCYNFFSWSLCKKQGQSNYVLYHIAWYLAGMLMDANSSMLFKLFCKITEKIAHYMNVVYCLTMHGIWLACWWMLMLQFHAFLVIQKYYWKNGSLYECKVVVIYFVLKVISYCIKDWMC